MLEGRLSYLASQLKRIAEHCARLEEENRQLRIRDSQQELERKALLEKCRAADERLGRVIDKLKSLSSNGEPSA